MNHIIIDQPKQNGRKLKPSFMAYQMLKNPQNQSVLNLVDCCGGYIMNFKAIYKYAIKSKNGMIIGVAVVIMLFVLLLPQTASATEWSNPKSMVITEHIPTTVFHAARGSNELPVIPIPGQQNKIHGDADGNGEINYMDALLVLRHSIGLAEICGDAIKYCDVDKNNELNYMDALLILRYSIGLITDFGD